jgi:hypothetical protein
MRVVTKLLVFLAVGGVILAVVVLSASTEPTVSVAPMDAVGPRPMEQQTQSSVIRDYLLAWQTMDAALTQNRPDLLDAVFVGKAKEKLVETIRQQQGLGIETSYLPRSHDIKVTFYSPEGLSIELLDEVQYDVHVRKGEQSLGSEHVRTQYIAVLSPTESRWKVRVFQGGTP